MFKLAKKIIKKSFNIFGLEIKKLGVDKFTWLNDFNINTIIDVGSNTGQFALEMRKCLPAARIYCFEPLKDIYDELVKNFKGNQKIKAFNVALGSFNGETKIFKNKFSPSSSILEMTNLHSEIFPYTKESIEENIEVRKLDDIASQENLELKPNILIKLDVQGYEDKVIQGGEELFKKAKIVLTEVSYYEFYKGQILFEEIYDYFKKRGFKYKGNINNIFNPLNGLPLYADAVFIKKM